MTAFLIAFLSMMAVAYALVAVATVKVWRPVSRGEGRLEDRPERVVYETTGTTRKRRCPRSARRRLRARGGARCPHRRGRPRS
jgi:hypothetical protein